MKYHSIFNINKHLSIFCGVLIILATKKKTKYQTKTANTYQANGRAVFISKMLFVSEIAIANPSNFSPIRIVLVINHNTVATI